MTLYLAREHYGAGPVADDRLLYVATNGENIFAPAADADVQVLPLAPFTSSGMAIEAARRASARGGTLAVDVFDPDQRVPVDQISWLVGQVHAATPAASLFDDVRRRMARHDGAAPGIARQILAVALAYHRANQHLLRNVSL